jgi:hypothetical protein
MRIKFNTTWEEDEEERRQYFASLSYQERLKCFIRTRKKFNFHKGSVKRFDFIIGDFKLRSAPYNV